MIFVKKNIPYDMPRGLSTHKLLLIDDSRNIPKKASLIVYEWIKLFTSSPNFVSKQKQKPEVLFSFSFNFFFFSSVPGLFFCDESGDKI